MKITKSVRLSKESVEKVERIAKQNNDTFSAAIEEIIKNAKSPSEATTITEKRIRELMREELKEGCFKTEGLNLSLGNSQVKYKPEDFEDKEINSDELGW